MAIQEQLQQDLKSAMRSGDKLRVDVIRMALAALKNAQMAQVKVAFDKAVEQGDEEGTTVDRNLPLDETAAQDTLKKELKRRRESAEAYRKGHREDLASQEDAEAAILESYLPRQRTADELRPEVEAVISSMGVSAADMGKVMPVLMQRFKGQADGKLLNQLAREYLSRQ